MNKLECVQLLKTLMGAYPNTRHDNPQGLLDSYMLVLSEYEAETVYKAARMYMSNPHNKYFPKAAEIKSLIPLAPYMFNPEAMAIPEESGSSENGSDEDDANVGCDICPYFLNGWAMSENGCHRRDCVIEKG